VVRSRPFRLLLAGSSVSILGTRISTIAFPMLVLWLTRSPVDAGWMAFAATAPSLLVYVPAGALVDLWRPRMVMLISECGRGAAIATVAAAVLFHRASLPLLIVAAVVEETLEVFSTLAERRYLSWLVGHEDPSPALVRMEARTHVMVLAGRPLGGLLFTIMPVLPFAVDALSFAISVISLAVIKTTQVTELVSRVRARIFAHAHVENNINGPAPQAAHGRAGQIPWKKLWNDICASTRWILHDHFARIAILLSAGTTLACQALIIVLLSYSYDQLRSPVLIGLALAASGLGGAIGSALASRLREPTRSHWTLVRMGTWTVSAVALEASGGKSLIFLTFVVGALGFTGALGNVQLSTYLLHKAPREMLACITSVGRLISFGACAVGPIIGGFLVQKLSLQAGTSLLFAAIFTLTFLSFPLLSPAIRRSRVRIVLKPAIIYAILIIVITIGTPLKHLPAADREDASWHGSTSNPMPEPANESAPGSLLGTPGV
jgi:MFS family permease